MRKNLFLLTLATSALIGLSSLCYATGDTVVLNVNVRDFKADGVLFEGNISSDKGLVAEQLGENHKPVYNLDKWNELFATDETAITQDMVNAFFNDVSGKNMKTKKTITLKPETVDVEYYDENTEEYYTKSEDMYVINSSVDEMGESSDGFFPIDNELFGNEENDHNFHFSVELHATFKYKKGDKFIFEGDDDVWVYFNNTLCVDLGGVHSAESEEVSIDDLVAEGKLNIKEGDYVSFDMFYMERHLSGSNMYVRTNIDFVNFNNSDWATYEIFKAYENELIPDSVVDANMSLPITRAQFAASSVKLYEALLGQKATPVTENPFTDTTDVEVLKALNLGITTGITETTFKPNDLINREQVATMLMRAIKAVNPDLTIDVSSAPQFADADKISPWAKESVLYMASINIVNGFNENGGLYFRPKNSTSDQEFSNYANATIEQALAISVRSFEKLKV